MKKSYLVIGMGRFGSNVAMELGRLGNDVMAIDTDEESLHIVENYVTSTAVADCRDEQVLKSLNPEDFDGVILAIAGDLESSILISVLLKELGVKFLVAKATNEMHRKVLLKVGVDKVIQPEKDIAKRIAFSLSNSSFMDIMNLEGDLSLAEVLTPSSWVGKSLKEINVNRRFNITIVAVMRGNASIFPVNGDLVFDPGDKIIAIGRSGSMEKIKD